MFRRHLDARRQGSDVIPIAWIDVHIEEHRFIEATRGGLSPLEMPGFRSEGSGCSQRKTPWLDVRHKKYQKNMVSCILLPDPIH